MKPTLVLIQMNLIMMMEIVLAWMGIWERSVKTAGMDTPTLGMGVIVRTIFILKINHILGTKIYTPY